MKKYKIYYIGLHLVLLSAYTFYYNSHQIGSAETVRMMGIFGWMQIILSFVSWKKLTGRLFVPYIIFLIAAYTFTFGQSFLDVFDLVAKNRSLLRKVSIVDIYHAQFVTLLFLLAFHIGAMVSYKSFKLSSNGIKKCHYYIEQYAIKRAGYILVTISFIPFIIINVMNLMIVSTYGYGGLYDAENKIEYAKYIGLLADNFIPGLLCLLFVTKPQSLAQRNILIVFALFVLLIMYCGGRSQGVVLVAIVLLYYHNYVKPLSLKKMALIGVSGFFFVSMLTAVQHLRGGSRKDYFNEIVNYKAESNPFFETISEMGGSMFPLVRTMRLVPQTEDYRYGSTYAYAATSIIPNLGFWELHPARLYANLGDWLVKKDRLTSGPGYSIVAEAYINLGMYGFVMMFVLGYFFCKLLNIDNKRQRQILPVLIAIIFSYMSLKMVRNSFLGVVRVLVYHILPIYLMVVYIMKRQIVNYIRLKKFNN